MAESERPTQSKKHPPGCFFCIAANGGLAENAAVQASQAIIIRLTKLTDTSLIVHWFTKEHGLVKTVAKGARRPKSPFAGQLDLFLGGEIVIQHARRGELHVLREVFIHHWREGLRRNYGAIAFRPDAVIMMIYYFLKFQYHHHHGVNLVKSPVQIRLVMSNLSFFHGGKHHYPHVNYLIYSNLNQKLNDSGNCL